MDKNNNLLYIIKSILDIDQNLTGIDYLKEYIKNIAIHLNVKYALIGHPLNDLSFIQTDVVWADGKFVDNFQYELKDTPCEFVITGERVCIHEKNVCINFPDDLLLQEMKIESYIGAPVVAKNKSGVGSILVLLDDKPMEDRDFIVAVTDFLAVRASAEIDKHLIEENLKEQVRIKTKKLEETKKELDKALKQSERKANRFFELSINLLIISDLDANIIDINEAWSECLGYTLEELKEIRFLDLVHPEDLEATIQEMSKLNNGETVEYFVNRYKHKNGSYKTLAWSASFDSIDRLIYGSAQDITENEVKEKILLLQSKKAIMGEMVDNIAHQWRQPLSTISTNASGLKLKYELDMLEKDDIPTITDSINSSVEYLSQTINDFRDFSSHKLKKKDFILKDVFDKSLKLISSEFNQSNITIINDAKDINYFGYENELIQVFINIINNAKDELINKTLDDKVISISTKIEDNDLVISIKDNAGGIKEENLDTIFNANFSTKSDSDGTGIGLHMSKTIIIKHMQGEIYAKNTTFEFNKKEYTGAEFIIKIPMSKQLPFIEWDDTKMNTGIEIIDKQHKMLIDIINKLSSMINSNASFEDIEIIIIELMNYAKMHFSTEEEVFDKLNLKESIKHKENHTFFLDELEKIKSKLYVSNNTLLVEDVYKFTTEWLLNHILYSDCEFVK